MFKKLILLIGILLYSLAGFGFSTSVGGNTDAGIASIKPQGDTTITMLDTGTESEQITRATIGGGNITVGGDTDPALADLNRDTNLAQEITRDITTGALDATLVLDNDMLLNRPLDILTSPWNAVNTTLGLANAIANIGYGAYTGNYVNAEMNDGVLSLTGAQLGQGAISLGNVITYYGGLKPDSIAPTYNFSENYSGFITPTENDYIILGNHENKHIEQSNYLGPLYLPVYFISGGISANNWMEQQADKTGNEAYKTKYIK